MHKQLEREAVRAAVDAAARDPLDVSVAQVSEADALCRHQHDIAHLILIRFWPDYSQVLLKNALPQVGKYRPRVQSAANRQVTDVTSAEMMVIMSAAKQVNRQIRMEACAFELLFSQGKG